MKKAIDSLKERKEKIINAEKEAPGNNRRSSGYQEFFSEEMGFDKVTAELYSNNLKTYKSIKVELLRKN